MASDIHDAFYRLTVTERDYERARAQRLERENAELRAKLIRAEVANGTIGVGALLGSDAQ